MHFFINFESFIEFSIINVQNLTKRCMKVARCDQRNSIASFKRLSREVLPYRIVFTFVQFTQQPDLFTPSSRLLQ